MLSRQDNDIMVVMLFVVSLFLVVVMVVMFAYGCVKSSMYGKA